MGEAKRKSTLAQMISVLVPERGRPTELARLVRSLVETSGDDRRYEILIAIDEDDEAWAAKRFNTEGFEADVRAFYWPRPPTLGEKLNRLAIQAQGTILWFIANDYVMETEGWPEKFRAAVAKLPNGIGVPFPHDDLHPDHSAFPILTKRMVSQKMGGCGFFMPPWFPFWFIDTHWDEIGTMLGPDHRFEIDVTVRAPEGRGKSHALVDLPFWVEFFNGTRPLRARDALNFAKVAYGEKARGFFDVADNIGQRVRSCEQRTAHLSRPAFLNHWSQQAASEPSPQYQEIKSHAQALLQTVRDATPRPLRVAICVPSGRSWEASTASAIAAMSSFSTSAGISIMMANVQTSMISMGRNKTVELVMGENCDYLLWIDSDIVAPPDTLVRLLRHDKDIVGCFYLKKTPPHDVNGVLAGEPPEKGTRLHGLHDALLLPGGCILVKADVYKKVGWPWFYESYEFPGDTGLIRFKALLQHYFPNVPPIDVLNSIDGTPLGEWMNRNYALGERGERFDVWSEDLSFCRKVRKHGYKLWCDVDLSYELRHLGEMGISPDRPDQVPTALAAE